MIERLDPRRLFATLTGYVFSDTDSSTTFQSPETGIRGDSVYLDANANGRFDIGETSVATDKTGQYAFKNLAAGDYLIGAIPTAGLGQTTPGSTGSVHGGFDIELVEDTPLTAVERRAFAQAAARWESIITGDLPTAAGIDDLRIHITIDRIDGPGGTLAQAEPTEFRKGSGLPYEGDIEFDKSDITTLISEGHLTDTITHEMAHVLGFGTIWSDLNLIRGEGTGNPRFTGHAAAAEYTRLFQTIASSVPVENQGGDGTADGHWPERTFAEELMTGFDESAGVVEPLSGITVAQFADLGYTVNLNAADVWNPLTHTTKITTPLSLGARAFERRVTLGGNETKSEVDFGYRADTAPTIRRFGATAATLGDNVTLTATGVADAEGDTIAGVSFWAETNGKPGLQSGKGGDTYVATRLAPRNGVFAVEAPTAGLSAGTQTYYAVASDTLGLASRRSGVGTLTAPPKPTRPNPVIATVTSSTSARLQWRDRSDDEIGFRVELFADVDYTDRLLAFNVPADTASTLLNNLTNGDTYYARVRAYGYGGASAYTRAAAFTA